MLAALEWYTRYIHLAECNISGILRTKESQYYDYTIDLDLKKGNPISSLLFRSQDLRSRPKTYK